jgi:hypothetical protein
MNQPGQAMATREEIPRDAWDDFLAEVTDTHLAYDVTIEAVGATIGDQEEAERIPFDNMTYDHKDDVVVIGVGGHTPRYPVVLRHMVWHPQRLFAHLPSAAEVSAIDVTDAEGTQTLVTFYERPALRPPDEG